MNFEKGFSVIKSYQSNINDTIGYILCYYLCNYLTSFVLCLFRIVFSNSAEFLHAFPISSVLMIVKYANAFTRAYDKVTTSKFLF